MPEISEEDLRHLEMKVKFFLNSSVRAVEEIERLEAANLQAQKELRQQSKTRRSKDDRRRRAAAKQVRNWDNVKVILATLKAKNKALEDELQRVCEMVVSTMDTEVLVLEAKKNNGVWETTPGEE